MMKELDKPVYNHFNEYVFMKKCCDHITECCFYDNPCGYHKEIKIIKTKGG